MNITVTQNSVI